MWISVFIHSQNLIKDTPLYKLYQQVHIVLSLPHRFRDDDMSFSINSDDPGIMRKNLVDDYVMAYKEIGLSYESIKKSVRSTSLHAMWQLLRLC